ncbi:hypothetical protein MMC14_007032 [Varicellaria rhodocarpa]|nr:hypothetical protein [Varicellaria rhodocarpa]
MVPIDVTKSQFFEFNGDIEAHPVHKLLSDTTALADTPKLRKRMAIPKTGVPLSSNTGFSKEWYIDDQVERLALDGAFTIFYFIQSDNAGGQRS